MIFTLILIIILGALVSYNVFGKSNSNTTSAQNLLSVSYPTHKGGFVKSLGEQRIANYLYSCGIEYEYEHTYIRKDGGINKPDFFLPEYDVYIEYFGMKNYSKKYRFEMHLKFETFKKENMKVITIYPKHFQNNTFEKGLTLQFRQLTGLDFPRKNKQVVHYTVSKDPQYSKNRVH